MISKNKTIAVIPARGGSKRLPGKNVKLLGKYPLLAHSIIYAKQFPDIIDEVYVSTDDHEIAEVARQYGAIVIERPAVISGDHEPTVSAVKHVLQNLDGDIDNVVLLQPTNPLRPSDLLGKAFELYLNSSSDSLFTVSRNLHKLGKVVDNKFKPYNYKLGQRSQDLEPLFYENGLLYITNRKLILEDKIISPDAFPQIIDHVFGTVDIDTAADFDYAEFLLFRM